MKDKMKEPEFDWENHEHISRSVLGMTQDKISFHPCRDDVEYVTWESLYGSPATSMRYDHPMFRRHGIELDTETRLLIEGNIDFTDGHAGGMDMRIDIGMAEDEKECLEVLLEYLDQAKKIIRSRLDHLKKEKNKGETK